MLETMLSIFVGGVIICLIWIVFLVFFPSGKDYDKAIEKAYPSLFEKMTDDNLKKDDVVFCETCKCLIKKEDAQKVDNWGDNIYYCKIHKKPYTRVCFYVGGGVKYFKELEVTEDGTPIGYKKINKK